MENLDRTKVILSVLLISSLAFGGVMLLKNKSAKIETPKEESVFLAEKDQLNKEIRNLANDKETLNSLNNEQKQRIEELLKQVELKNREIQRMVNSNAKVKELTTKLKELEAIRDKLKNECSGLYKEIEDKNLLNEELGSQISILKSTNDRLSLELSILKSLHSGNMLVNGVKRNQKITVLASRSRVISLDFDFPEKYLNEIGISIQTPENKTFKLEDTEFVKLTEMTANSSTDVNGISIKRMKLLFKSQKKFAKGIYTFTILRSSEKIASVQIKMR